MNDGAAISKSHDLFYLFRICNLIVIQELLSRKGEYEKEAAWLQETLVRLTSLGGDAETGASSTEATLRQLQEEYRALEPLCQAIAKSSDMVMECHDYKDKVEKKVDWLRDMSMSLAEDLVVDDLQHAKSLLSEHEVLLLVAFV